MHQLIEGNTRYGPTLIQAIRLITRKEYEKLCSESLQHFMTGF